MPCQTFEDLQRKGEEVKNFRIAKRMCFEDCETLSDKINRRLSYAATAASYAGLGISTATTGPIGALGAPAAVQSCIASADMIETHYERCVRRCGDRYDSRIDKTLEFQACRQEVLWNNKKFSKDWRNAKLFVSSTLA